MLVIRAERAWVAEIQASCECVVGTLKGWVPVCAADPRLPASESWHGTSVPALERRGASACGQTTCRQQEHAGQARTLLVYKRQAYGTHFLQYRVPQ